MMRGITLIIATVFIISAQDVIFKIFITDLTLWQIFTLRGILTLPLLLLFARIQTVSLVNLGSSFKKWVVLRSIFLTLTYLSFYAALPFLNLATVGAAVYIAPIFVALLSAYSIKEPVRLHGWIGVFMGFIGVIILLQPGSDVFSLWALLPVLGACFYALAHITTRTKCQSVPLPAMALSVNLVMLTAGLLISGILLFWPQDTEIARSYPYIYGHWSTVSISEWLVLGLLAVLSVMIGLGMAEAYQVAPPAIIAIFEYCYLIFVVIWDYLFFATSPNSTTILGMLLIIGAGLLVLRRYS